MDTFDAIRSRRSIRKFEDRPVDRTLIEQILQAGIDAPSAKNRQPWRFVVITGDAARGEMSSVLREGLAVREAMNPTEDELQFLKGTRHTVGIMEQAPVNVFLLNPHGKQPWEPLNPYGERFMEMANVQSVGAAIQNMCLAATALGLGSLWIADVYDLCHAIAQWLSTDDQLVAALSIGWPGESPDARPRKKMDDITLWR